MKRKIALAMVLAMTATMAQPVLAADSKLLLMLSSVSMVLRLRPGGLSLRKILKQRILISI